ncbi:hypothetical protein Prudu_1167S000200 [Prunus dulcis]|uniref:Uncharacterized protein n=1 Tax=Prunus dulcis TaxID=3755 RepID=A0A4Y1QUK9_PRUDU|nr:hypothetical protein Prudu_004049 [Prunus dulcis]BBN69767.1 hypothetical protein Prudu_1167S000200 [Prunus dulcis]
MVVPERLRRVSEKAYTPQVVSIGPLHHGKEGLKAMEDHKKRYLQDYIRRTRVSLADYVQKVKDQEAKLRSCYAETIQDVWPDMRLLENQLPFFILEELFDPDKIEVSSNNNNIERLSILNLCHNFFKI